MFQDSNHNWKGDCKNQVTLDFLPKRRHEFVEKSKPLHYKVN